MNQEYDKTYILELLQKWKAGKLTIEERADLERWDRSHSDDILNLNAGTDPDQILERILSKVHSEIHADELVVKKVVPLWLKWVVAAAVATIIFGAGFFYMKWNGRAVVQQVTYKNDVAPGKQGATLTLSNGRKISLTDVGNGMLAQEAGVEITKTADGRVVYTTRHPEGGTTEEPVSGGGGSLPGVEMTKGGRSLPGVEMTGRGEMVGMNTISTANGQTYQLRLPDGTLVWLNAASKLTYTANLVSNGKRSVELSGEAYFEVAKDASHPFIVKSGGQQVKVLGTHFNVNSYADEAGTKTTLLEGSVQINTLQSLSLSGRDVGTTERVDGDKNSSLPAGGISPRGGERMRNGEGMRNADKAVVLKPGEQAANSGGIIKVKEVDVDLAVGWKNNKFIFERQDIREIMRSIARWYDVEVVYTGAPVKEVYWGSVSRFDSVSKVLRQLEASGNVHFQIKGRRIYVSP